MGELTKFIEKEKELKKKANYFLTMFVRGKRFYNLSKKEQSELKLLIVELNKTTF